MHLLAYLSFFCLLAFAQSPASLLWLSWPSHFVYYKTFSSSKIDFLSVSLSRDDVITWRRLTSSLGFVWRHHLASFDVITWRRLTSPMQTRLRDNRHLKTVTCLPKEVLCSQACEGSKIMNYDSRGIMTRNLPRCWLQSCNLRSVTGLTTAEWVQATKIC